MIEILEEDTCICVYLGKQFNESSRLEGYGLFLRYTLVEFESFKTNIGYSEGVFRNGLMTNGFDLVEQGTETEI